MIFLVRSPSAKIMVLSTDISCYSSVSMTFWTWVMSGGMSSFLVSSGKAIFGMLLWWGDHLTVFVNPLCSFFLDVHAVTPLLL